MQIVVRSYEPIRIPPTGKFSHYVECWEYQDGVTVTKTQKGYHASIPNPARTEDLNTWGHSPHLHAWGDSLNAAYQILKDLPKWNKSPQS